jgi:hypothetical protein
MVLERTCQEEVVVYLVTALRAISTESHGIGSVLYINEDDETACEDVEIRQKLYGRELSIEINMTYSNQNQ